jgi:hypothetical protein
MMPLPKCKKWDYCSSYHDRGWCGGCSEYISPSSSEEPIYEKLSEATLQKFEEDLRTRLRNVCGKW